MRRAVVMALRHGESAAGQILPQAPLSKPALSKHLRALQQAGVIRFRRKGTRLMYHLNSQALKPVAQFLEAMSSRE
jgi:DNA-binding transcriptional ArsR family regulator